MNALNVEAYSILWDDSFRGISDAITEAGLRPTRICVVSDDVVAPRYLDALTAALAPLRATVETMILPAGESHKHLGTVEKIYRKLSDSHLDRRDLLIALGGGVVGDMTGFAAATYLRGISFVQVPTTLLAMVDSSIGGKTGVDLIGLKNMVGAFHQPRLVYMNLRTLESLPDEQFACGMAEVIKTALIRDAQFAAWLEGHADAIMNRDGTALRHMIRTCCAIKADVVREDPTEQGIRAILNFGHTIGHAVEKCSNFALLHGQSVAVGMAAALRLCVMRGLLSQRDCDRALALIGRFDLPLKVSGYDPSEIFDVTKSDKKMRAGAIRFVLLDAIGSAVLCDDLTEEELRAAISWVC